MPWKKEERERTVWDWADLRPQSTAEASNMENDIRYPRADPNPEHIPAASEYLVPAPATP
jgi:hypothetical protein